MWGLVIESGQVKQAVKPPHPCRWGDWEHKCSCTCVVHRRSRLASHSSMVTTDTCGRSHQPKASNFALLHLCYHKGTVFCPSDADVDTQGWFYVFACVGASSTCGTVPTEIHIPRLTQKLPSPFFGFHAVLPFQLELRVMHWNLHPLQVWQSL